MGQYTEISIQPGIKVLRFAGEHESGYAAASIANLQSCLSAEQKHTPQEFTYDDTGSQLFDAFVQAEAYYLPKKEIEILKKYGQRIAQLCGPLDVFDVGSGSGRKTAILLKAFSEMHGHCRYYPIDINEQIMVEGAQRIRRENPRTTINCVAGSYSTVFQEPLASPNKKLVLFLGSSISQEKDDRMLAAIRANLTSGEFFLLAYDRLKDPEILCSAYDNPAAEKLSRNVLQNLNKVFDADFNPSQFRFHVRFNPRIGGCETGQLSLRDQNVTLRKLGFSVHFADSELLRTGMQLKFSPESLCERVETLGFRTIETFSDSDNWYSVTLFEAVGAPAQCQG